MLLREYTLFAILVSLASVNALSLAIRMPSVLSKGGGGRGGGGSGGGRGSSSSGGGRSRGSIGANTGRGLSGDTGHPAVNFPANGRNRRFANYFSKGGGKPFTLPSSSAFAGRKMGGGTRKQIVGTPRYASGYPYSVSTEEYNTTRRGVYGQPFPFGFYPIYWGYHGYGGEYAGGEGQNIQYNLSVITERPGGNLSYVHLAPKNGSYYATTTRTDSYWMIGDYESVSTILSLLVDRASKPYGCGAENSTILPFITVRADGGPLQYNISLSPNGISVNNNTNTTLGSHTSANSTLNNNGTMLPFRFENVIQWYRASSFALVHQGYNNTYAFPPLNETTSPSDWASSTPLPYDVDHSPFMHCLNLTIYSALPILDAEPKRTLSTGALVGIILGSLFGAAAIGGISFWLWNRHVQKKEKKKYKKQSKKWKKEYKAVSTEHERKSSDGPVVDDDERTIVEDHMPLTYSDKSLVPNAK
ncbi:SubName: Full=Uncharacterized protein {ECO:0000313/EMBL:CCA69042.1} [Serendipita indica DSM 11827]|uniref:Peptidase A1 domain-containing protein n=1 Tax=Serendipita indica (strain DSM 11827) TaxID=1109443 RepID=G4TCI9_SERID|nr:SubName: Full=Uncharacterized protein {ECO:0000313/EMBL:CCA69042.1} [Serendipita indica DSM 11827]CCA69042.1 hypothetical protein PIIN_02901 [Serendipita indica DSM 11827]